MIVLNFELINVILQMVFALISTFVGLKLISKYFKYRQKTLILVGLVCIGMVEIRYATILSYLYSIITGKMFIVEIFLLIGVLFIPLAFYIWILAFTKFIYIEYNKVILIVIGLYNVIIECFFLYFVFTNSSILAVLHGPINVEWKFFLKIYFISVLIMLLITGFIFYLKTLKSGDPEIVLKGKFLLFSFIMFVIGSLIDAILFTDNILILLIARIILISSSIGFYLGFILPESIKRLLL